MAEPKPTESTPTQIPNPPNTAPTTQTPSPPNTAPAHPPHPPQPPASLPPKTKKRPLDSAVQIQDSKYFKIRLVLKDLRPHLIEVFRTADFKNCKAAYEIREQTKILMELYEKMMPEPALTAGSKNVHGTQPSSGENGTEQKPQVQPQQNGLSRPSDGKSFQPGIVSEMQRPKDVETSGTYIVGGSAFGWNFITFTGSQPMYYGRTKESFRSAQAST